MGKRTRAPKVDALTKQQEKFARHYALHGNGAEAYHHAYPASRKHTPQYRAEHACKLLAQAKIAAKVASLKGKAAQIAERSFEITAERVIQEIAAIAFQNSGEIFDWGTYERQVYRKNKETGRHEPVVDKDGNHVTELVPYARAKPSSELSRQQKAAILSASETISRTGDRLIEIKMADKVGALKLLGQHLSLFKVGIDAKLGGVGGGPISVVVMNAESNL